MTDQPSQSASVSTREDTEDPTLPRPNIAETRNNSDPGDDTGQRFRYQYVYGAILCLRLLSGELIYVYCEHHEDVLVQYTDGSFGCLQIKTRAEGLEPFKATEIQITNALTRFLRLIIEFGDQLSKFVLATNCGFWRVDKTKHNLGHIIKVACELIAAGKELTGEPLLGELLGHFRAVDGCTDTAINTLFVNLHLQDGLPHLDDIDTRLAEHLAETDGLEDLPLLVLKAAGNNLTDRIARASSHGCEPNYRDYAALLRSDDDDLLAKAVIEGKRIDRSVVTQVLDPYRAPKSFLVRSNVAPPLVENPRLSSKLTIKMERGGISDQNVELAKELQQAAEMAGIESVSKWGSTKALERWSQICVIVKNECQEAHDECAGVSDPFGGNMLLSVRQRLRHRYETSASEFFGFKYEHLLGVAAVLTEECKVWWSPRFSIEEGNVDGSG